MFRWAAQQLATLAHLTKPMFRGHYLIITNTVTCGFLLGAGDVIQQSLERRQKPTRHWEKDRTVHMFITGCSMGPLLHFWYSWIDKIVPGKGLQRVKIVVMKVTIDQLFAPFFGTWYFLFMGMLQGHTLAANWKEFKAKFWDYYLAELSVWPACQLINFLFLPPIYRVLFVNTVTLGWNIYLSYLKHRD